MQTANALSWYYNGSSTSLADNPVQTDLETIVRIAHSPLLSIAVASWGVCAGLVAADPQRGLALFLGNGDPQRIAEVSLTHRRVVVVAKDFTQAAAWREKNTSDTVQYVTWDGPGMLWPRLAESVFADPALLGLTSEQCGDLVAPNGELRVKEGDTWRQKPIPVKAPFGSWTHSRGDAGGNSVAKGADHVPPTASGFPVGLRWQDGLIWNPIFVHDTRGVVAADGRVFALTKVVTNASIGKNVDGWWIETRSAWNGVPLWRHRLGNWNAPDALHFTGVGPLAVVGGQVFAPTVEGLAVLSATTGERLRTLPFPHPVIRLAVDNDLVIMSGWAGAAKKGDPFLDAVIGNNASLRSNGIGVVSAFSQRTGELLWSKPVASERVWIHNGMAVLMVGKDTIAVDGRTGTERWKMELADPMVVGDGVVAVRSPSNGSVVDVNTGKQRFAIPKMAHIAFLHPGELWMPGGVFGLTNGELLRPLPGFGGANYCFWPVQWGHVVEASRSGRYQFLNVNVGNGKDRNNGAFAWGGLRGSCYVGLVPSQGSMIFTPDKCTCVPAAIGGFTAISYEEPLSTEIWNAPRPVEMFVKSESGPSSASSQSPWPGQMGGGERRGAGPFAGKNLRLMWSTKVVEDFQAKDEEINGPACEGNITPPVIGGGHVVVADQHRGVVVALQQTTGAVVWRTTLPARVRAAPTWMAGRWLVGCDDGWVYALNNDKGTVLWRTRIAPSPATAMTWGQLASRWPVHGGILDAGALAVAVAGRSSEIDGGIAVVAMDPGNGQVKWTARLAPGVNHRVDIALLQGDKVMVAGVAISLTDGTVQGKAKTLPEQKIWNVGMHGIIDPAATQGKSPREGTNVAGKPALCAAWDQTGGAVFAAGSKAVNALPPATWNYSLDKEQRVEALAISPSHMVVALAGWNKAKSMVCLLDRNTGISQAELVLTAPPVRHGIALGPHTLWISSKDGNVHAINGQ